MENVAVNPGDFKPVEHKNSAFSTHGVSFTLLPDLAARRKRFVHFEKIEHFAGACRGTRAPSKSELPLVFMGRLGREPSDKDCLRYAANVTALTGCCGDYDGPRFGALPFMIDTIEARLRAEGIEAVVAETPSSTFTTPRCRIWCPASGEYTDALRETLALWVSRLNGVLNGQLAPESFRLAQAFFVGRVDGKPAPYVSVVKGTRIDLRTDLDEGAIYSNGTNEPPSYSIDDDAPVPEDLEESADDPWLMREGRRRKINFLRSKAKDKTGTPTATGDRAFGLVQWLADMRTEDGLILSPAGIAAILGDDFPNTTPGAIRAMLSLRRKPRGWDEI
jgi:hypothetical protein